MNQRNLKELTFEEAIERLDEIVNKLESNTLPLEKALELFQMGITLVNHCNSKIEEAEGTIEILLKNEEGRLQEIPFSIEHEENLNGF